MNTSYFANLRHVAVPLSISLYSPRWYEGPQFKSLAPTPAILSAYNDSALTDAEYTTQFRRTVLDMLDARQTYNELTLKYGPGVTLLCYEKPGDFCHRRLVAKWFERELGVTVPELTVTPNKPLFQR